MSDFLLTTVRALVCFGGFIFPGWVWARALNWPLPAFAGFMLSALLIFAGVLALQLAGVPITFVSLGTWLVAWIVAGVACSRRATLAAREASKLRWSDAWLALPALPMLGVAVWRATVHALPGADNVFRWNHLALQIASRGHLDYYPPTTAHDFGVYFWADGIAPLVSSLYGWTYLAVGSTSIQWTAIPVLIAYAALMALLHRWGSLLGGTRAGWYAVALAGATMLLQFACSLGQETALTALGAGGMLYYLSEDARGAGGSSWMAAAVCAAVAACAREYGAWFVIPGIAWLMWRKVPLQRIVAFALLAVAIAAVWHVRNWIKTGNPLYAHDVAQLFPMNPVFHAWMQGYVETYGGIFRTAEGWREIARLLLMSAVPGLVGFGLGLAGLRRQPGTVATAFVGVLAVAAWAASVPFTAGGFFYSMRVMSPLMVIGCVWGGVVLARKFGTGKPVLLVAGLALFGCDAALRAFTIPINPYTVSPSEWKDAGYRIQLDFARDDEDFIRGVVAQVDGRVLSDSAGLQPYFSAANKELVPLWSPDVLFLFSGPPQPELALKLRSLGFSHVLFKRSPYTVDFLNSTGALPQLVPALRLEAENPLYVLFALKGASPETQVPAARP